jgi:hypothetical protein
MELLAALIAPLLWLTFGCSALAWELYTASGRLGKRLSPEKLAGLHKPHSQSFETIWMGLSGLYCTFEAIRALISEVDTRWLWLLAAAAQFAALPGGRHSGVKLGAVKVQPDVETQRRHRRTLWFAVPAVACLYAAQPVAESAARLNNGFVGAASIVLGFAGLAAPLGPPLRPIQATTQAGSSPANWTPAQHPCRGRPHTHRAHTAASPTPPRRPRAGLTWRSRPARRPARRQPRGSRDSARRSTRQSKTAPDQPGGLGRRAPRPA